MTEPSSSARTCLDERSESTIASVSASLVDDPFGRAREGRDRGSDDVDGGGCGGCGGDGSSGNGDVTAWHIHDINSQVAQFRDLLISIGQARDCPELRERIRKLRRGCVEACKRTSQMVLPQMRSAMDSGIPADSPNLVLLFFLAQLFLRELYKSKNLVRIVPMDMTGYFGNNRPATRRATPTRELLAPFAKFHFPSRNPLALLSTANSTSPRDLPALDP
ncbi:PREDICTED: uncharacterized protein LOC105367079 [Ceratosolen solmsi marchali]|uniref:Uncharacterized protein LOC105367079 n=1 Tax=Ceratosolen solmsi marchali TaxID=326594 RepID=A0AAJ6YTE1_9HYME|nr:PREDICTED: uncharacterized protein LOC105367079 [Ceratosolen solmsi marchali]